MPKTLRGSFDQALRPLPSVDKASNAKEEGVGGTRALAHSINVIDCDCKTVAPCHMPGLVVDEVLPRVFRDIAKLVQQVI